MEICFNSKCDSLQLAGDLMPNLLELKVNDSLITGLRDIGTSM